MTLVDPRAATAWPDGAPALRDEQAASFVREDFTRYFAVSERLAAADPGFCRSYEYWTHTVLHALGAAEPDLRVLQVGAMDGKRYDPVYAFVKHYGWAATILEPLPDLFAVLQCHYADCPKVTLVQAALTAEDGPGTMWRVDRDAAHAGLVPFWAEGLGSFDPARNALGGVGVDPELHAALLAHARQEVVPCLTLQTLAGRTGLTRIDLLQVDAEGCELDIVRQVDGAGFRPRALHLEHWALTPAERGELLGLLGARGYLLRMSESDLMAIDPALRGAIDAAVGWTC